MDENRAIQSSFASLAQIIGRIPDTENCSALCTTLILMAERLCSGLVTLCLMDCLRQPGAILRSITFLTEQNRLKCSLPEAAGHRQCPLPCSRGQKSDGADCEKYLSVFSVQEDAIDISYTAGTTIKTVLTFAGKPRQMKFEAAYGEAFRRLFMPYIHRMAVEQLFGERTQSGSASITEREREILAWTAEGKSVNEIATIIGITENTTKFHLKNIYRKLNAVNRYHAVSIALQLSII